MALELLVLLPLAAAGLVTRVVLSVPTVLLAALLSAPFGRDFVWAAGRVALAAGDTPPGDWRIVYVPPFDVREYRREHAEEFADAELDYLWDEFDELEEDLRQRAAHATRGTPHGRAYGDPRDRRGDRAVAAGARAVHRRRRRGGRAGGRLRPARCRTPRRELSRLSGSKHEA
jgi:hypothetical protein